MRPGEATNTQVVVSKVYLPNLVSLYVVGKTTYLNLKWEKAKGSGLSPPGYNFDFTEKKNRGGYIDLMVPIGLGNLTNADGTDSNLVIYHWDQGVTSMPTMLQHGMCCNT